MTELEEFSDGSTQDGSFIQDDDYLVIKGNSDISSCNIHNQQVDCTTGADGEVMCKIPPMYPDYQGDVIIKERGKSKNNVSKFQFPKFLQKRAECSSYESKLNDFKLLLIKYPLIFQCFAEFIGTGFIVLFGCGSVASAVLTNALVGLWQVAIIWTFGVALSIYVTASISGAHLNPAVSLAFAIFRRKNFPFYKLFPFILSQFLGAICGAIILLFFFDNQINSVLEAGGASKGDGSNLSISTASLFGEYFPNPGFIEIISDVSVFQALSIEAFGTGILMFNILALSDNRNKAVRNKDFAPFLIGVTVGVLICIFAPYTQAGWNPARDFGPRLVACFAGWWSDAIPGPKSGFWIYIVGPFIGSIFGALFYDIFISLGLTSVHKEQTE